MGGVGGNGGLCVESLQGGGDVREFGFTEGGRTVVPACGPKVVVQRGGGTVVPACGSKVVVQGWGGGMCVLATQSQCY